MSAGKFKRNLKAADKPTLYWALYRLLDAVHAARYAATADDKPEQKAILHIIGITADHWGPLIPGMPSLEQAMREGRADDAHHERTALGERLRTYLTGDEFM
jgi:hypothetical protein